MGGNGSCKLYLLWSRTFHDTHEKVVYICSWGSEIKLFGKIIRAVITLEPDYWNYYADLRRFIYMDLQNALILRHAYFIIAATFSTLGLN